MKNALTKKSKKAIKQLAAIFPEKRMKESHRINVLGSELIKKGVTETNDKKAVQEKEVYTSYNTGSKSVNHAKRMETAYTSSGREGVKQYGESFLKPEHMDEWRKVVDAVFNYEETGIRIIQEPESVQVDGYDTEQLDIPSEAAVSGVDELA